MIISSKFKKCFMKIDRFNRILIKKWLKNFLHGLKNSSEYASYTLEDIEFFDEDSYRTVFIVTSSLPSQEDEFSSYLIIERTQKEHGFWSFCGWWFNECDRPSIDFENGKAVHGAW